MPLRILQTADLHLKEGGDERWQALEEIIKLGKKKQADVLVISGDLFDKDAAGEKLRPKIRTLLSKAPFDKILIPGNHDAAVYRAGLHFGENCKIIRAFEDCPFTLKDVNFFGLPFKESEPKQVLEKLRSLSEKAEPGKSNILLYHGELLDTFFSRHDFGDEGGRRYMPARLSYFKELGFDYVLSGHFHTKFQDWQFGSNQFFVYPGSPVSITKREKGQRKVNFFEVQAPPAPQTLASSYFKEINLNFSPFERQEPIKALKQALRSVDSNAKIILRIRGFVDCAKIQTTEQELIKEIEKETEALELASQDLGFKDISYVLEDGLFQDFERRLQAEEWEPAQKEEIRNLVIEAMAETALKSPS